MGSRGFSGCLSARHGETKRLLERITERLNKQRSVPTVETGCSTATKHTGRGEYHALNPDINGPGRKSLRQVFQMLGSIRQETLWGGAGGGGKWGISTGLAWTDQGRMGRRVWVCPTQDCRLPEMENLWAGSRDGFQAAGMEEGGDNARGPGREGRSLGPHFGNFCCNALRASSQRGPEIASDSEKNPARGNAGAFPGGKTVCDGW
eukprot:EG_transcript_15358